MAFAQCQREDAAILLLDIFEDIGREFEIGVIADQPRIAVDRHHPDVALVTHQHAQGAAMPTGRATGLVQHDDARAQRHPEIDHGQPARFDLCLEIRAVDQEIRPHLRLRALRQGCCQNGGRAGLQQMAAGEIILHQANSLISASGCASTKWPPPSGR